MTKLDETIKFSGPEGENNIGLVNGTDEKILWKNKSILAGKCRKDLNSHIVWSHNAYCLLYIYDFITHSNLSQNIYFPFYFHFAHNGKPMLHGYRLLAVENKKWTKFKKKTENAPTASIWAPCHYDSHRINSFSSRSFANVTLLISHSLQNCQLEIKRRRKKIIW